MSSTVWVSGDTHFGEAQAISLFRRPFADVADMDAALIDSLNRSVKKRDVLIHIGDFCGPCAKGRRAQIDHAAQVRGKIRCKNIWLIRGNHDPKGDRFRSLFESVHEQLRLRSGDGDHRVVLSHYPLRAWRGQLSGAMHLYGHTHGALEEMDRSMDVGVDCWDYAPLRMDFAVRILSSRSWPTLEGWTRRQPVRRDDAVTNHDRVRDENSRDSTKMDPP